MMDANRLIAALDRIADAVDRIDRATATTGGEPLGLRLAQIGARHDKLKSELRDVMTALDGLIDGAGGAVHG